MTSVIFYYKKRNFMETQKRLSKSIRKHIRLEKALIRKTSFDTKKQEELISNLYKKYSGDIMNKEAGQKATASDGVPQNAVKSPKPKKEAKKIKSEKKSKKNEVQKN